MYLSFPRPDTDPEPKFAKFLRTTKEDEGATTNISNCFSQWEKHHVRRGNDVAAIILALRMFILVVITIVS